MAVCPSLLSSSIAACIPTALLVVEVCDTLHILVKKGIPTTTLSAGTNAVISSTASLTNGSEATEPASEPA